MKIIYVFVVLIMISIFTLSFVFAKFLFQGMKDVHNTGLKSTITRVWEGNNEIKKASNLERDIISE